MSPGDKEEPRKVELRRIIPHIEVDFAENTYYRGTIKYVRRAKGLWNWAFHTGTVPRGIEGFFKRRGEDRLQAAIEEAILKQMWNSRGRYIEIRRVD